MKHATVLITLTAFVIISSFTYEDPPKSPLENSTFAQSPPIPNRYWIQQYRDPTGEFNLSLTVEYISDEILPEGIALFSDSGLELVLRDNGISPDLIAGDRKYVALFREDLGALISKIESTERILKERGSFLDFIGHVGRFIDYRNIAHFKKWAFLDGKEVEISLHLLDAVTCNTDLVKHKSLFITDLSIVEDHLRTYNAYTGIGNPLGRWTFGTLMSNIDNGAHPDGLRGFLKDWVENWMSPQIVNGQTVATRDYVFDTMIRPWLIKANNDQFLFVDQTNWQSVWGNTPEYEIRINAPFKLTAIVNRLDLRSNSAYSNSVNQAGETRFIYTLIDPNTGLIPKNPDQTASSTVGFIDWRGMNVILEYANAPTTRCAVKALGQQWLDLSDPSLTFGSSTTNNSYKDALQSITDQVTAVNASPSRINGSAINRIRTNEKCFAPTTPGIDSHESWEKQDWEFRQFELSEITGGLVMVPLTNTPPHSANYAPNIQEDYSGSSQSITNNDILDWIYPEKRYKVFFGNFNISQNLLTASGIVRREQTQTFGFESSAFANMGNYDAAIESEQAKMIRHQLSLNTCAGCHAGDTKTVFTHVSPIPPNEPARYWNPIPDGAIGIQDGALYPWGGSDPLQQGGENIGNTSEISGSITSNFTVFQEIENHTFFQNVSPFLTGRRYQIQNGVSSWEDDEFDNTNEYQGNFEVGDNLSTGLFYVNDPSNGGENLFPFRDFTKWGFNDLERRKTDLCLLLNQNCLGLTVFDAIIGITSVPLPEDAH